MEPARSAALAAALLLSALGAAFAEGAFFAAALPLAAWAALGLWLKAPRPGLAAERRLSAAFAEAGAPVEIRLRVRNLGPGLELLEVEESLPEGARLLSGSLSWRGRLEAGASVEFAYRASFPRGVHRLGGPAARSLEAFAATEARAEPACPSLLVAAPRALLPPGLALSAAAARAFAGRSRARRRGSGTDFAGTREYSPGDPLKSLNWRAEALWGQGVVNVFEEERALDAGVILDARAEAYDGTALFEAAVQAAASAAEALLSGGHRVAFLSYGSTVEWTAPGSGREQGQRLRLAAARARLGNHAVFERFDNLPIGLFPPRSAILLVSPLLREDLRPLRSLAALGYAVTVLRPDPLGAADEPAAGGAASPPAGAAGGATGGSVGAAGAAAKAAVAATAAAPAARASAPPSAAGLARRVLELEYRALRSRLAASRIEVLDWRPGTPLTGLAARRRGRR